MKIRICFLLIIISFQFTYGQTLPKVSSGSIVRIENFQSRFVTSRNVDVWLPEGYSANVKYTDASNTFIMGSSMGGLISAYALCEYPNVFGGAACLSTHTPLAAPNLINEKTDVEVASKFRDYLEKNLPEANTRKIYFDYGSLTLDAYYKPYQVKIDDLMKRKGYDAAHWLTMEFAGTDHSETSWNRRLYVPVLFLLSSNSAIHSINNLIVF
jgi:pimeloyl-ACP methyl ester carboxylesterase